MIPIITGIAHYLPARVVSNDELSTRYPKVGTPDDIYGKTGILERRYSDDLTTSEMSTKAVVDLLQKTKISPIDIDLVIVGTSTPDSFDFPDAFRVIKNIGAINASGFNITAACPGFLFALQQANIAIKSGEAKKVIVCGVDRMSSTLDAFNHKTGVLFGDAAAAILIESRPGDKARGINRCLSKTIASNIDNVYMKTHFTQDTSGFVIDGKKVYRDGVDLMSNFIKEFFKKYSLRHEDFKYIVPHQANGRMLKEIAGELKIPLDKFLINIQHVGNTAAASIPLCISQKSDDGIIQKGDRLLLVSFGAGYVLSLTDLFF